MNITLHQLRVFKKVALLKSVTKASNALHMSQPAVSNILKILSEICGHPVIEVLQKKVYLTEVGEILLQSAEEIENILEETRVKIVLNKGLVAGNLRVAAVSTAKYFLPRLLGKFKARYPNVHIELKIKNREEIIERLQKNIDDFVIMSQLPALFALDSHDFYEDQLVVAASIHHPLVRQKNLTLKHLASQPWLIREVGSGTRIAMINILKKYHIKPHIEMEIDNNEAIKQAMIGNIGISIVSKQSIELEVKTKLIKILNVQGFPIRHEWYLVKSKGKKLSSIAQKFYEFVKESTK